MQQVTKGFEKMFRLGDPPNYEPAAEDSIRLHIPSRRPGSQEVAYDILLEQDGHELIFLPFTNYTDRDHEVILEMMKDESLFGLGDVAAHCRLICDATVPTYLLTHWVRDRNRGERLPLEWVVKRQTRDNAEFFGLHDRGTLAPGMKADVNVIDRSHDLETTTYCPRPAGGRSTPGLKRPRAMWQPSVGRDPQPGGIHGGALPGTLVRGRQKPPAA